MQQNQTSDSLHLSAPSGQHGQAPTPLKYRAVSDGYSVLCDGRLVGHIRLTLGAAFRYFPKGGGSPGAVFRTLAECKQSLEAA